MCRLRTRPRTNVDPPRVELPLVGGHIVSPPRGDNLYYDTIRDAVLTCANKLTQISLIHRTEPKIEKWRKRKTKKRICSEVSVRVCCSGPMLRQTDGQRNKPTNVIHRLCSAYYAGSANKTMKILSKYVVTLYTDICCSLDCDAVLLSVCRCHFQSKIFNVVRTAVHEGAVESQNYRLIRKGL